jgi:hypothetical protein
MAETEKHDPAPENQEGIVQEKKQTWLNRTLFGSLPRIFATFTVFSIVAMVLYARVGPKSSAIIKKSSQMQSATAAVQEVNKDAGEKIKQLEAEKSALAAQVAQQQGATTSAPINVQSPPSPPGGASTALQTPPFGPNNTNNRGASIPSGPMGAISQGIGAGAVGTSMPTKPEYSPMQRVSVDQRSVFSLSQPQSPTTTSALQSAQSQKSCPGTGDCAQDKNLLGGARAMGSLFNGVLAVEGLPYPVTIDLKTMTRGPNSTSVGIKDCTVLAVGTANISSGRLMIEPKELNCYIGGKYITAEVDGYVVDLADQRQGLKGSVEENDGKYIAQLILGSAIGGFGAGIAQNNVTTAYSASTSTGTSLVTGNALQYGAGQGVNNAAQAYAKRVADRASKILSYVDVAPQDRIVVVFTKSVHIDDSTPDHAGNRELSSWVK